MFCFYFFKRKTAYEMRISDWSSDVCSSDLLDDARVAGFGHRTGTEVGGHVHGVAVDPAQAALGLRALEAAFHPLLRGQVELAGHVGVGAAARERDQAAGVVRAQAVGAVPDPVLAFGLVQRVEVEQGFPLRSEEHTSEL